MNFAPSPVGRFQGVAMNPCAIRKYQKRGAIMQVRDVMTPGVECAHPSDSIAFAAARMRQLEVGSLPVCGEGHKLVGIITDRDITVRATSQGCDPFETSVTDIMTPGIVTCFEDDDIQAAI